MTVSKDFKIGVYNYLIDQLEEEVKSWENDLGYEINEERKEQKDFVIKFYQEYLNLLEFDKKGLEKEDEEVLRIPCEPAKVVRN